jgi:hypothetical protein
MTVDRRQKTTKAARIRELYRSAFGQPALSDQELVAMREHVIRLAQTICEHVWGKRFY